ncbi:hypothetical protein BDW68DRAFT_185135 [Aspergillus falconensis]
MSFNSLSSNLPSIDPQQVLVPIVQHLSGQPDVFGVVYRRPGVEDYTLSDMFYIPEQATWSLYKLPDILYVIRPPDEYRNKAEQPVQKTSYKIFGKQVNDFETILPRQISSNVEGWRLEAWMRHDPRITAEDIIDRVHPLYREYISGAQIHDRRKEFRQHCNITCWEAGPEDNDNVKITNLLEEYGYEPWSTNSTRELSPGLINPTLGEEGGRIALQKALVPRFDSPDSVAYWVYEASPWDTVSFWFSVSRNSISPQPVKPNHFVKNLSKANPPKTEYITLQNAVVPPAQALVHSAPAAVELQPRAITIPHTQKRAPSDVAKR